ncbi:MAG: hypothetical protein ACI4L9_01295 [Candidatus Coproplasma sp.]
MDNTTQNLQATADTAEAEGDSAATELGKFKNVSALLDAYNSLEAEFTRRSQRLKELENAVKEQNAPVHTASAQASPQQAVNQDGENLLDAARSDEDVKNAIISEFLEKAMKNRGVPIVTGGINVSAKRNSPATVREAGELARQFLNKREN